MQYLANAALIASTLSASVLFTLPSHAASFSAINSRPAIFNLGATEADIIASGAASVTVGDTTIYIGTQQTSSNQQDPILASFTNGVRDWARVDYDGSPADGRGVGLVWDGADSLYAAFTIDGGTPRGQGLTRFTQSGWLTSYGSGGGAPASVLLQIDPSTGSGVTGVGTYIRSQLMSGRTNTVRPTGLELISDGVVFFGDSFFSPLRTDRTRMTQTASGDSPFDYRVLFSSDLTQALNAEAIGWDGVTAFSDLGEPIDDGDDDDPVDDDPINDDPIDDGDDAPIDDDPIDDGDDDPIDDGGDDPVDDDPIDDGGDDPIDDGDDIPIGDGNDVQSVPEPGVLVGLGAVLAAGKMLKRRQS